MNHTYLLPWDLMTHRFVVGHSNNEDGATVVKPWSIGRASGPAGRIVTNVKGMLNYAQFQLGDGTFNGRRLLMPESLEKLHTPQVQFTPNNSVALTFWVDDSRTIRTIGHGGGTVGQTSLLTMVPNHDFSILLVTNSGNGRQLNPKVTNFALEHYLGIDTPDPSLIEIPQKQLREYNGSYEATLTAAVVGSSDGKLTIERRSLGGFPTKDIPPPPMEPLAPVHYGFYSKDQIVGLEDPYKGDLGQFLRNPDGSIAWLRLGTRIHRPLYRHS
jgi:hypothetical protein